MRWLADSNVGANRVAEIIYAAGGRIVGRTRLQKMVYLMTVTGFDHTFSFEYRHYGPYSDQLASATSLSCMEGLVHEDQQIAIWGGSYSVYTSSTTSSLSHTSDIKQFLLKANEANSIELELAATAVFLAGEGYEDPWKETALRKPDKATRLPEAQELLRELRKVRVPLPLPVI